jgi:hypothetical protein
MEANKETGAEGNEKVISQTEGLPDDGAIQDGGEFKIEIRRLEVPVRPRGVLAE